MVAHNNKYNDGYHATFPDLTRKLCMLGLDEVRIAEVLGVHRSLLGVWKKTYPEFRQAYDEGRDLADAEVAHCLYQRCLGYSHPDTHISTSRDPKTGQVTVTKTDIVKHYPPDVVAMIFWLKNRHRSLWRDVTRQEQTGANGEAIQHKIDLADITTDELRLAARIGIHLAGKRKADKDMGELEESVPVE